MAKHRFRESIKSFFGSHIDRDKDEELKGTKIEMDDKVQTILKLLKEEDGDDKNALIGLIEDFNKHYQSVYDRYDHLTGELREKVHGKKGKDDSSSSSSDSDSDDSSKKKGSKNGKLQNHKVVDDIKEELQTANNEIVSLKTKLTVAIGEKEALDSEYHVALNKIEETDKIVGELKLDVDRLSDENSKLLLDNSNLNLKLEETEKVEAELNQKIEKTEKQKSDLILEKETAMGIIEEEKRSNAELGAIIPQLKDEKEAFKLQLEDVKGQLKSTEEELLNLRRAVDAAEDEKNSLLAKNSELSDEILAEQGKTQEFVAECAQLREKLVDAEREILSHTEIHETHKSETTTRIRGFEEELVLVHSLKKEIETQKEEELSTLLKKFEEKERGLLSEIEQLKENVSGLELEVETLRVQKGEQEVQVQELMDQVSKKQQEVESLQSQKDEAETQLEQKLLEISEYVIQIETLGQELESKTENEQKLLEAKEEYVTLLRNYEQQIQSLESVKSESENEIQKKTLEVSESLVQIESLKEELAYKTADHERVLEEKEGYVAKVKDLELEIETLQALKLQIEMDLEKKNQDISEFQTQIESLKDELASKIEEHVRTLGDKEKHFTKVNVLELELASLITLKLQLEKEIENKDIENLNLQETLQGQILELKKTLVEKEEELSKLLAAVSDNSAQVLASKAQVINLQEELDSLTALKIESDSELEKKVGELSDLFIQIENLKEELASKMADGEKMLEEKVALAAEVSSLRNQTNELEEQVFSKGQEIDRLREENEGLQRKISELDSSVRERDEEFFSLEKKLEAVKNEGTTQIEILYDELNSLKGEKNELELLIERGKRESSESLTEVENKNLELASRIEEQERLIKSLEGDLSKLNEEQKQLEAAFEECKEKLQVAEDEIKSKERRVDQMEEIIEDLKRDIEIKGDEVSTMVETVRNLEVKVRLSNQKLRITEQLLNEKEDDHTSKEEKFQQENKSLLEKISLLYGIISSYKEAEGKVTKEISEKVNSSLNGMDALTMKFEEDYGHIETCVYEIMNEIQVAKSWVKDVNSERHQLQQTIQDKVEQELLLSEKIGKLTAELIKDETEKDNLKKVVTKLEEKIGELEKVVYEKDHKMREFEKLVNEKNEGILCLGEEKREVIRQLCIWSDYQRDHFNYVKEMLLKKTRGPRQV